MISAEEARQKVLENITLQGSESVSLSESVGRILAAQVVAPIDLPPFDHAAMDGFAVRCGDAERASLDQPISLKIISRIQAGDSGPLPILQPGEAVSIMTGAPLPPNADAVVAYEETLSPCSGCRLGSPVRAGNHLRRKGEDCRKGETVLQKGDRLTSRAIALLAALGLESVSVFKKPRIRIVCTGTELTPPGKTLSEGTIYNSNGPALDAVLKELGLGASSIASAADSTEALRPVLAAGLDGDILLTVGGVSAGDFDLVPEVLKEMGATILFHRVKIKPGKPFLFARKGKALIFGLPGNPVSALMVFDRFVRPALLKMMGASHTQRRRWIAVAAEDLKGTEGKEDYLRGIVEKHNGIGLARSAGPQGSANLKTLARANAILIIPADKSKIAAGETLEAEWLTEDL